MTDRDPNEPLGTDSPTEAWSVPTQPTIEPVEGTPPTPAPTTPAVPAAAPRRPSRLRWAVAIAVVALVVAASGVAAVLVTGRAPNATVLGWVPADSVAYAEFRLDLPGDQRDNVAEFLSHFPGFDDQAAIDTKLDEAFDQFLSSASEGDQSYTRDIAPWFEGELAFSMGSLPDPSTVEQDPSEMAAPDVAFLLSITDRALAQAWFDAAVEDSNPTTEEYNGYTLTLQTEPEGRVRGTMAYAVTDDVVVIGEVEAVKKALDTNGDGKIADDPEFAAALDSGSGDHVGFMYFDMTGYWDWAMSIGERTGQAGQMPTAGLMDGFRDLMPAWGAFWLRVEGDALQWQLASDAPAERTGPTENRQSVLASRVPASAVLYGETHDYGKALRDLIGLYEDVPLPEGSAPMLDQVGTMLGGIDGITGWIGDVAFTVATTADGIEGGVLIQNVDTTKAENLFLTLRSALTLAGSSAGFTVTDEQHGDATITTVDFGTLRSLMEMSGESIPPDMQVFGGGLDGHVQLSWTVTDDLVVIGIGPGFVTHVLDTEPAESLAESDRFTTLVDRVGAENTGLWFADVTAIRAALEKVSYDKLEHLQRYETEVKPFLAPFDALVGSSVVGDPDRSTFLITVK